MLFKKSLLLLSLATLLIIPINTYAKPMPAPTIDQALRSEWIVVGRFISYKKKSTVKVDYFDGVIATYEVIQILKNRTLRKQIKIHYEFQDGSACIASEGWKFEKDTMPKVGSTWILFLNRQDNGELFTTYRGDYGRWKATKEEITTLQKRLVTIKEQ